MISLIWNMLEISIERVIGVSFNTWINATDCVSFMDCSIKLSLI